MSGDDRKDSAGDDAARDRRNKLLGRLLIVVLGLVVLAYIVPMFLSLK